MSKLVSPNEDFHRYQHQVGGTDTSPLFQVVVRSSMPELVLTQDGYVTDRAILPIDSSKDLTVYADVVVIRGSLALYGRSVEIVARRIVGEKDSAGEGPAIIVDGRDAEATDGALVKPGPPGPAGNGNRANDAKIVRDFATADITAADDGQQGNNGEDGRAGAGGGDAGRITLWAESLSSPNTSLRFSARGGHAAPGETGQDGGAGQDGGNGAFLTIQVPGGRGRAPSTVPYTAAGGKGGPGGWAGWGGAGGAGGAGGRIEIGVTKSDQPFAAHVVDQTGLIDFPHGVQSKLKLTAVQFAELLRRGVRGPSTTCGAVRLASGPDVSAGRAGLRGQDGSPGQSGAGGINYDRSGKEVSRTASPGAAANAKPRPPDPAPASAGAVSQRTTLSYRDLMPHSDPAQLDMTLQAAKMAYLVEDFARCDELLLYLVNRLAPFRPAPRQQPPDVPGLTPGDVNWLIRLEQEASTLQIRRQQGLNAFGYRPNYVPLAEYSVYLDWLTSLIADYKQVDDTYTSYQQNYENASAARDALRIAVDQSALLQTIRASERQQAIGDLNTLSDLLSQDEARLLVAGKSLQSAISGLEKKIASYFNCNVQEIISALGLIAFVPPVHQVQGPSREAGAAAAETGAAGIAGAVGKVGWALSPVGGVMAAAQAVAIYDSAVNYVTTADGVQVSKANLIADVREVGGDLASLQEGYTWARTRAGQLQVNLDDPGGIKLLASIGALQKQLASLPADLQAPNVRQAIQGYVDAIQTRNQDVLRYNATLAVLVKIEAEQQATERRIGEVRSRISDDADPTLPQLTTYLGRAYQDLRDDALRCLFLVSRAFACWSLQERDLWGVLGFRARAKVTPAELLAAKDAIRTSINDVTENYFGAFGTGATPPVGMEGPGVVVKIDNPVALADLRDTGRMTIRIEAPAYESDGSSTSPFAGSANVRVRRARTWVVGARASGWLRVQLTQLGTLGDSFVRTDDTTVTFVHGAVRAATFWYQADQAPPADVDPPIYADLIRRKYIINKEPDFPVYFKNDQAGATKGVSGIGPFAWWEVAINKEENTDLDLSGVSSVWIDFWVTDQSRAAN